MLNYQKVIGYKFVNNKMNELVNEMRVRIEKNKKTFIVTANPEIIMYANNNSWYEKTLKDADYIIPDGIGIILASKLFQTPLKERLPGFELMEELLHLANQMEYSIYFLGTKPGVIELTVKEILKVYPKINVSGYHHGYFQEDECKIIEEIKGKKPDIVLVGLGYPKQEKWIAENLHQFDKGIFIGLGGCFNIWAGVTKRAPEVWRKSNLEWFYRIIKEPVRLRRAMAIPKFLFIVATNSSFKKMLWLKSILSKTLR